MAFYRVTIREISTEKNKYYVEFLPVHDKDDKPTGEAPIKCYYSDLRFDHLDYSGCGNHSGIPIYTFKPILLEHSPPINPGEVDYCHGPIWGNDIGKNKHSFLVDEMGQRIAELVNKAYQVPQTKGENPLLGASFYATQGRRKTHEDTHIIAPLNKNFASLNDNQIIKAMLDSFAEAQSKFGMENCGSTAIVCLVINEKIYIASLGDSTAYTVTDTTQVEKLNEELHDKKLIDPNGRGSLNLNGAIGDNEYGKNICHIPIITIKELSKDVLLHIIKLIIACDGLTEQSKYDHTNVKPDVRLLAEMLKKHPNFTPEILAKTAILEYLSGDNITVVEVDLNYLLNQKQPAIFAVFDGHGGKIVSKKLADNFYQILCHHLQLALGVNLSSVKATVFHHDEKKPMEKINPLSFLDTKFEKIPKEFQIGLSNYYYALDKTYDPMENANNGWNDVSPKSRIELLYRVKAFTQSPTLLSDEAGVYYFGNVDWKKKTLEERKEMWRSLAIEKYPQQPRKNNPNF